MRNRFIPVNVFKLEGIEGELHPRLYTKVVYIQKRDTYKYRMVGNFREGFIFAFFASQEPFAKIKIAKFMLSTCKASEPRFNLATSNYLSVLTAT